MCNIDDDDDMACSSGTNEMNLVGKKRYLHLAFFRTGKFIMDLCNDLTNVMTKN